MNVPGTRLLSAFDPALKYRFFAFATVLFGFSTIAQNIQYQSLLSFGPPSLEGKRPYVGLIQADDGLLYGTTLQGGISNAGTIFRLSANGTAATNLYTFGVVPADGQSPLALLQSSNGVIYGTTSIGGTSNIGTIYKITKDGAGYQVLHNFRGAPLDGANPQSGLVQGSDGLFYGTTYFGGSNDLGTVYKANADASSFSILHHFRGGNSDGANPDTSVIQGRDGWLYGTTFFGGTNNAGTVFKLNTNGGGFVLLHNFLGAAGDGKNPDAALVQASDGALYGTTYSGGSNNFGTVYTVSTNGSGSGGYTVLHTFAATAGDGQSPLATLAEGAGGMLYGTTYQGGSAGAGTVFQLNKDGTGYLVLRSFNTNGVDGQNPRAGVLQARDLSLYGTTWNGGQSGFGTVYRFLPLATPQMRALLQAGNSVHVLFTGVSGNVYNVYRSTNLSSWTLSGTLTMPLSGIGTNVDSTAGLRGAWYRAAWMP